MSSLQTQIARSNKWGYLFVSPWLALFGVFMLYPLFLSFYLSFFSYNYVTPNERAFVGLGNWIESIADGLFWRSVLNILYNQVVFNFLILVIGLSVALLLKEVSRGGRIFRTLYFAPVMVSVVVLMQVGGSILSPSGPLQTWLIQVGLLKEAFFWQNDPWLAMPIVAVINSWKWFGIYTVILLAGLIRIDPQLYEAAALDGASAWRRFWHISLPQLNPQILFILVMNGINGLQMFGESFSLFGLTGGVNKQGLTPVLYLYDVALGSQHDMGRAAALGVLLAIIIAIITIFNFRFVQRDVG